MHITSSSLVLRRWLVLVAVAAVVVDGVSLIARSNANPMSKVVTLLSAMQDKVRRQGEKDTALFNKFLCYCRTHGDQLAKSIEAAEDKLPQLESTIEEAAAEKERLSNDAKQASSDRADAKRTLQEGRELRDKESSAFDAESQQGKANLKAIDAAIAALRDGTAGSFLQSDAAATLRRATLAVDLASTDRDTLSEFLSSDASAEGDAADEGASPGSDEIIGVLEQLREGMAKELSDAATTEETAIKEHAAMAKAKGEQISTLTKALETRISRSGEVSEELVSLRSEYDDTSKGLQEDRSFQKELSDDCAAKQRIQNEAENMRSKELVAIGETIKVLNDDSAKDTFKKSLKAAPVSFLQVQVTAEDLRREALSILRTARRRRGAGDPRLDLLSLALRSKKTSFDSVVKTIDGMHARLQSEQKDDDRQRSWCRQEFAKSKDDISTIKLDASNNAKVIAEEEEKMAASSADIAALVLSLKALDGMVSDATSQRKEEHKESVEEMASMSAAKDLIEKAMNRLRQFYNPRLAKDDSFVQDGADAEDAEDQPDVPDAPPEAPAPYKKSQEEGGGVLAMLSQLKGTLDKQIAELSADEKAEQAAYEKAIKESGKKRATDAESVAHLEELKAFQEGQHHKYVHESKRLQKDSRAADVYAQELHKSCDWLLAHYDERKAARSQNGESLQRAKAVLSGADAPSFLEVARKVSTSTARRLQHLRGDG